MSSSSIQETPGALPSGDPPAGNQASLAAGVKILATTLLVAAYLGFRTPASMWLNDLWEQATGEKLKLANWAVLIAAMVFATILVLWRKVLFKDQRYQAPVLITAILVIGDAGYSILENHSSSLLNSLTHGLITTYSPTFAAILTCVAIELVAGRFFHGKWPHLASAYISGISAGILIKSSVLWPFVACATISILSKYVLRIGNRHLWNPTNFGVTMMLLLGSEHVASLSVQASNAVWPVLVIWILGSAIMLRLGRFHIPLAFMLAFIPLAFLRARFTGNLWVAEIAPLTSPMFQLYIFFMITDPKTTTRRMWSQTLVAVLVAVMDTVLRLVFEDVQSFYHALFIVGPIANVIEICWTRAAAVSPVSGLANHAGVTPQPAPLAPVIGGEARGVRGQPLQKQTPSAPSDGGH
jgi:enediyne biosynthesis protein E5